MESTQHNILLDEVCQPFGAGGLIFSFMVRYIYPDTKVTNLSQKSHENVSGKSYDMSNAKAGRPLYIAFGY